ncbi:MAG: amidohydrolase family protein [Vicinamibacteria bacterium]
MTMDTLYRAAVVLPVTSPPIRDGFVAVRGGEVLGLGPIHDRPAGAFEEIDLGRAILMPGFVNAHTHLELSHLEGAVSAERGFVAWIEEQLRVRAEHSQDEVPAAIRKAIAGLETRGTVAVADVSNSLSAVGPLGESGLHAVVFHEILGFDPSKAASVIDQTRIARQSARAKLLPSLGSSSPGVRAGEGTRPPRVRIEVAAHAPHSISKELFALLMKDEGVRSIHVAESRSEDEFLRDGSGEWRSFLDRRVGPIPFAAPRSTPVQYLDALGVLLPGLLAVHCVRVDEADAKLLATRSAVAVLCPRSNEFLGNGVPPLALLLGQGVPLALGTDSLASCPSLDVLEDARLLARKFPRVPKAVILNALTRGGALALGFLTLGAIQVGASSRFALVVFDGAPPSDPEAFVLHESVSARGIR